MSKSFFLFTNGSCHKNLIKTYNQRDNLRLRVSGYQTPISSNSTSRGETLVLSIFDVYWTTTLAGSTSSSWLLGDAGTAADRGRRFVGLPLRGGWGLVALLADAALGDLGFWRGEPWKQISVLGSSSCVWWCVNKLSSKTVGTVKKKGLWRP